MAIWLYTSSCSVSKHTTRRIKSSSWTLEAAAIPAAVWCLMLRLGLNLHHSFFSTVEFCLELMSTQTKLHQVWSRPPESGKFDHVPIIFHVRNLPIWHELFIQTQTSACREKPSWKVKHPALVPRTFKYRLDVFALLCALIGWFDLPADRCQTCQPYLGILKNMVGFKIPWPEHVEQHVHPIVWSHWTDLLGILHV